MRVERRRDPLVWGQRMVVLERSSSSSLLHQIHCHFVVTTVESTGEAEGREKKSEEKAKVDEGAEEEAKGESEDLRPLYMSDGLSRSVSLAFGPSQTRQRFNAMHASRVTNLKTAVYGAKLRHVFFVILGFGRPLLARNESRVERRVE
ncbi:Os01g0307201 [Oryza sativa Japonica Group]|uniref:Os01g0307201 protein n=1 Tax=Oryza sativa subsp. japonica TaxID=39947 RepID=A0A0P0V1K8_ORYSJ|nr:Os01g0307201 [Oryza sativa Japonica Group]